MAGINPPIFLKSSVIIKIYARYKVFVENISDNQNIK